MVSTFAWEKLSIGEIIKRSKARFFIGRRSLSFKNKDLFKLIQNKDSTIEGQEHKRSDYACRNLKKLVSNSCV